MSWHFHCLVSPRPHLLMSKAFSKQLFFYLFFGLILLKNSWMLWVSSRTDPTHPLFGLWLFNLLWKPHTLWGAPRSSHKQTPCYPLTQLTIPVRYQLDISWLTGHIYWCCLPCLLLMIPVWLWDTKVPVIGL